MSGYITITPKYEPLDLDTMLKVPMMLTEEKDKQNKDIEEYKDKISKFKAMLGPDADKVFGDYDKLVGLIQPNSTVQELKNIASQMKENYRDRNAKLEAALPAYESQRKRFLDNPDLLGDPGTLFTYYNDPTYNPFSADGKKIAEEASEAMKAVVAGQTPEYMGKLKGDPSKLLYRRGFSDEQLEGFIEDATSGNPQTNMGKIYNNILKKYGYDNLDPYNKERAKKYLRNSLNEGRYQTSTTSDPDYAQRQAFYRNQRAKGYVDGLGYGYRLTTGREKEDTENGTFAYKIDPKTGNIEIHKQIGKGKWKLATSFIDASGHQYPDPVSEGYFPSSIKTTDTEITDEAVASNWTKDDGKVKEGIAPSYVNGAWLTGYDDQGRKNALKISNKQDLINGLNALGEKASKKVKDNVLDQYELAREAYDNKFGNVVYYLFWNSEKKAPDICVYKYKEKDKKETVYSSDFDEYFGGDNEGLN